VLPCLPHLSSLIINESEAGALLDVSAKVEGADKDINWNLLEGMAQGLISRGVSRLAVIHTPAGVVAADSTGKTWRQGSVKVPETQIRGTTGAGDAFAAGVVYGLHEDWGVQDCIRLGVAAAAQNVQSHLTAVGVKRFADTLAEAETFGYR
ncbi:MAG: PfkB family carbohydrate kinase, partial [Candidatus Nanopelagicales bacterium]